MQHEHACKDYQPYHDNLFVSIIPDAFIFRMHDAAGIIMNGLFLLEELSQTSKP